MQLDYIKKIVDLVIEFMFRAFNYGVWPTFLGLQASVDEIAGYHIDKRTGDLIEAYARPQVCFCLSTSQQNY